MHRLRAPSKDRYSDQYAAEPEYLNVVLAVETFLRESLTQLTEAGIGAERILLDPGLGFGKSVEQNMALISHTSVFRELGRPVLSALSRKSFVGRVSLERDSDPSERLEGTIALTALHLANGARVFRVHDVEPIASALRAAWAVEKSARGGE